MHIPSLGQRWFHPSFSTRTNSELFGRQRSLSSACFLQQAETLGPLPPRLAALDVETFFMWVFRANKHPLICRLQCGNLQVQHLTMSAFQAGETCSDASCGWMSAYHDCNYSRDGASRFRVGAPLRNQTADWRRWQGPVPFYF